MKVALENEHELHIKDTKYLSYILAAVFIYGGAHIFFGDNTAQPWYIPWLFLLIFSGSGIVIILKTTHRLSVFRKDIGKAGLLTLTLRSLLKKEVLAFPFSRMREIELAEVVKSSSAGGKITRQRSYAINCIVDAKERVLIGTTSSQKKATLVAGKIAVFVGVPLNEQRPPSVSEAIGAIKEAVIGEVRKAQKDKEKNTF
jgi:hypothetical protein